MLAATVPARVEPGATRGASSLYALLCLKKRSSALLAQPHQPLTTATVISLRSTRHTPRTITSHKRNAQVLCHFQRRVEFAVSGFEHIGMSCQNTPIESELRLSTARSTAQSGSRLGLRRGVWTNAADRLACKMSWWPKHAALGQSQEKGEV